MITINTNDKYIFSRGEHVAFVLSASPVPTLSLKHPWSRISCAGTDPPYWAIQKLPIVLQGQASTTPGVSEAQSYRSTANWRINLGYPSASGGNLQHLGEAFPKLWYSSAMCTSRELSFEGFPGSYSANRGLKQVLLGIQEHDYVHPENFAARVAPLNFLP